MIPGNVNLETIKLSMKTWRQHYQPMIAKIIKENEGLEPKKIRMILAKANPGPWKHQQRIWSDESLKQLGLKKRKNEVAPENENQTKLF